MNYLGDFAEDTTIRIPLTTHAKTGGRIAPLSAFESADFKIYKNGSATEKTTTNGITITSPFDSIVGLHVLEIDTNNNTDDVGFWTTGADYWVVLSPDETVDGETVVAVVATFSIQNRYAAGGLDAAGVRAAMGLAAANLDTQLEGIPTVSEFNARSLPSADYFVVSDYTAPANSDIAAILADTNELQTNQGNWLTANVSGLATSQGVADAIESLDNKIDTVQNTLVGVARTTEVDGILDVLGVPTTTIAGDIQSIEFSPNISVNPEVTVNPTELSQESIDEIRDGLATLESLETIEATVDIGATAPPGWINAPAFADNAITSSAIAGNAITGTKIEPGALALQTVQANRQTQGIFGSGSTSTTAVLTPFLQFMSSFPNAYVGSLLVNTSTLESVTIVANTGAATANEPRIVTVSPPWVTVPTIGQNFIIYAGCPIRGLATSAQVAAVQDAVEGIDAGLTGPNAITVTVTDSDDDEPIEAASVRFYRTGSTGTQTTDEDGETVFGLTTATWSWIATAPGYSSKTGVLSVSGDAPLAIELDSIVAVVLDDPALASLSVKCLDEAGAIEPGAKVYLRIVGIPTGSTGLSFDGISQEATADSSGIAKLTIVKLGKYEIRRGDSKQWKAFTAGSGDTQTIVSFIGSDPVVT